MNTENSNESVDNSDTPDDLDEFENLFFQRETAEEVAEEESEETPDEEDAEEEEVEETDEEVDDEDDTLATEEDEDASEEEDEEDDEPEEEEEKPRAKRNRKSAKERIEELVADKRQTERELQALRAEFESLRARVQPEEKAEDAAPTLREQLPADAPQPDAVDKDGKPIYELGEFDPTYIRDLTRFTIEQERAAAAVRAEQEAEQKALAETQERVKEQWLTNLEKAEEELPDIRESIGDMASVFTNIDPGYGEYLAMTVMSSDLGPQIMYYLSQNIGEAQKIVASGPAAATLAIGRLEAKLSSTKRDESKRNTKRVSDAPPPPQERVRGNRGQFSVRPDTDDLDAFEREFYKRK